MLGVVLAPEDRFEINCNLFCRTFELYPPLLDLDDA
jgi:hypothetical protein